MSEERWRMNSGELPPEASEMPLKREPDAVSSLPLGKMEGEMVLSKGCQLEDKAEALIIQFRAAQGTAAVESRRDQHMPRTREMSEGKRRLLSRWLRKVRASKQRRINKTGRSS